MLVSEAFAQDGGGFGGGAFEALLPMLLIFVVFYFLLIRPQQRKVRQHREMLAAVRRGDRVVTGGGILGTVTKVVDDNELVVEIADRVRVHVQRAMISAVLAKTEPVKHEAKAAGSAPATESKGKQEGGAGAAGLAATGDSVPAASAPSDPLATVARVIRRALSGGKGP